MRRTITTLAVATLAAIALPALPASAQTIAAIENPTTGCTHYIYGPDVTINTFPKPGVTKEGGFGASVDCP